MLRNANTGYDETGSVGEFVTGIPRVVLVVSSERQVILCAVWLTEGS